MNYKEQIKDKRWISKSKEIRDRDRFCQVCYTKENLNAHHVYYIAGLDYWDYPDNLLITLCNDCHSQEHKYKDEFNKRVKAALGHGILYHELIDKLILIEPKTEADGYREYSTYLMDIIDYYQAKQKNIIDKNSGEYIKIDLLIDKNQDELERIYHEK